LIGKSALGIKQSASHMESST